MSRLFTFLGFAVVLYGFSACSCDCPKDNQHLPKGPEIIGSPQRTGNASGGGNEKATALFAGMAAKVQKLVEIQRTDLAMSSLPKGSDLSKMMIPTTKEKNDIDADASALVMTVFNSLLKAEGNENQLDMQFSMSDKPVEDGIFLFALKTPDGFKGVQKLTFQMFNEDGFEMVANNQFQVTPGNNYKAINVKDLSHGIYIFRLSDGGTQELLRRVQIGEIQNN